MDGLTVSCLFDLRDSLAAPLFEGLTYPFEALPKIGEFIKKLGEELDPALYEKLGENVWVSREAVVAASASVTGPCIIDSGSEVRHCAFIRGNVFIGKNCVVGNSTELKNSVLLGNVQVPHYNYVGDSVLGFYSHLGAGAITSNVKSDKTHVTVKYDGGRIETGLKKFGAVVGDFVEVGCGSVLNPGTVIGRNTNVYPLSMVRGVIPADSIYKKHGEVVDKII